MKWTAFLLFATLGCGTPSEATLSPAASSNQAPQTSQTPDLAILQKAVSGLSLQIAMASLAPTHGAGSSVSKFAAYVYDLSTHGQSQLSETARRHGGTVDSTLQNEDAGRVTALQSLYGPSFEARYLHEQKCRLETATTEAEAARLQAVDPEIAAFAERSIGEIRDLLAQTKAAARAAQVPLVDCSRVGEGA